MAGTVRKGGKEEKRWICKVKERPREGEIDGTERGRCVDAL